ncbi:hypothetical protein [Modestobacter roseus]|uniref:Uncharacterized protein n=1 Tax=Modestobacter roseus TaxID=1181884 RepID=A0A562IUE8_9ACTN|nr:hypothetical protein [Modestobacter roseus]MQA33073.1 hypothetical protein [Modestobacter roseus]TWH74470.1 hypothetical protein JD78_03009 [Modestobacter roseus]
MTAPWGSFGRDRLSTGWSWPAEREQVADELRATGARVGSCTFAVPELAAVGEPLVLEVRWAPGGQLALRIWAVPTADAAAVAAELAGGWLARACRWAADAPSRDAGWTATTHALFVTRPAGRLTALEA